MSKSPADEALAKAVPNSLLRRLIAATKKHDTHPAKFLAGAKGIYDESIGNRLDLAYLVQNLKKHAENFKKPIEKKVSVDLSKEEVEKLKKEAKEKEIQEAIQKSQSDLEILPENQKIAKQIQYIQSLIGKTEITESFIRNEILSKQIELQRAEIAVKDVEGQHTPLPLVERILSKLNYVLSEENQDKLYALREHATIENHETLNSKKPFSQELIKKLDSHINEVEKIQALRTELLQFKKRIAENIAPHSAPEKQPTPEEKHTPRLRGG